MWRRALADQRGSVTVVWVGLLCLVLAVVVAVLDREWVNYMSKLVEQTADLAAEAAADSHELHARLWANRSRAVVSIVNVCIHSDAKGKCDLSADVPWVSWQYDKFWVGDVREKDLLPNWRQYFQCDPHDNPYAGWVCATPVVDYRWVVFLPDAKSRGEDTFINNWHDRPHARARPELVTVIVDGDKRTVSVSAMLEVDSLFGLYRTETVMLGGRSVVQGKELVFP